MSNKKKDDLDYHGKLDLLLEIVQAQSEVIEDLKLEVQELIESVANLSNGGDGFTLQDE